MTRMRRPSADKAELGITSAASSVCSQGALRVTLLSSFSYGLRLSSSLRFPTDRLQRCVHHVRVVELCGVAGFLSCHGQEACGEGLVPLHGEAGHISDD